METAKKNLANLVLFAALGAAVMFFYSAVFIEKEWRVTGKLVIIPGGTPSTLQNVGYELGNTKEIIGSMKFRETVFAEQSVNFLDVAPQPISSVLAVNFLAKQDEIERIENMIALIPGEVAKHARELYGGDPFKYRLVADPEVSESPVVPNVMRNVSFGAIAGAVLYVLGMLFFSSSQSGKKTEKTGSEVMEALFARSVGKTEPAVEKSKEIPAEKNEVMREVAAELQKPKEQIDFSGKRESAKIEEAPMRADSAPSNLPTGGGQDEPTDEEIKSRLNKLMRGEL